MGETKRLGNGELEKGEKIETEVKGKNKIHRRGAPLTEGAEDKKERREKTEVGVQP